MMIQQRYETTACSCNATNQTGKTEGLRRHCHLDSGSTVSSEQPITDTLALSSRLGLRLGLEAILDAKPGEIQDVLEEAKILATHGKSATQRCRRGNNKAASVKPRPPVKELMNC